MPFRRSSDDTSETIIGQQTDGRTIRAAVIRRLKNLPGASTGYVRFTPKESRLLLARAGQTTHFEDAFFRIKEVQAAA